MRNRIIFYIAERFSLPKAPRLNLFLEVILFEWEANRYVQFDPAVIEQARQIDLLSYLQRYEPSNLKRVAGNVYCTREHDSLKISNGKWYWWSRDFGGYSALDYLMKVREYSFVEAVQTLTGDMGDWKPPPPAVKKDEPKVLLLSEKNANCDKMTEYLFGRGIDYQLIQDCIAEGIIFDGRKYHNAVFVGKGKSERQSMQLLGVRLAAPLRATHRAATSGIRSDFWQEDQRIRCIPEYVELIKAVIPMPMWLYRRRDYPEIFRILGRRFVV